MRQDEIKRDESAMADGKVQSLEGLLFVEGSCRSAVGVGCYGSCGASTTIRQGTPLSRSKDPVLEDIATMRHAADPSDHVNLMKSTVTSVRLKVNNHPVGTFVSAMILSHHMSRGDVI